MSGGSYNYACHKVDYFIEDVRTKDANPDIEKMRKDFVEHLKNISDAMKAIEWVDSGDRGPGDEIEPIKKCLPYFARISALKEAAEIATIAASSPGFTHQEFAEEIEFRILSLIEKEQEHHD